MEILKAEAVVEAVYRKDVNKGNAENSLNNSKSVQESKGNLRSKSRTIKYNTSKINCPLLANLWLRYEV